MNPDPLFDFTSFPQLETERLLLRAITPDDCDAIFAIFGDPAVSRYLDHDTLTKREAALEIIEWITNIFQQKQGLRWGITIKDAPGTVIGTCGYNIWHRPDADGQPGRRGVKAEIGYDLAQAYWRGAYQA